MFRTLLRHVLPALALVWGTQALAATAVDPTTAGSFGSASTEYRFPAKVDAKVTDKAVTEIWAKVWYPTKLVSSAPIVVLLHGNHGTCGRAVTVSGQKFRIDDKTDYSTTGKCPAGYVVTPNHAGYDYVASRLATNGFLVLSINANRGITAAPESPQENDPGLILRRGRMILRHLELLGQWNRGQITLGGLPNSLRGKLNFSRITLFGHSRGGDAIVAAYNFLKTSAAWRQRLPAGSKILALASMAPTDFQTSRPSVLGAALGVLLPMCDSDVVRLSGIGFYDRSVLPGKDTAGNFKSVLDVWRTNHNGYNTQWQTDDSYQAPDHTCPGQGTRLFKFRIGLSPQQQAIGRYFLMGLARGRSQSATFGQLFNPAYVLPTGLRSLTRIDRGYFVGTRAATRLLVRFDGTCGQKLLVTTNVAGTCLSPSNANGAPAEHDKTTSAARVRWNRTGQSANFTLFVLNKGTPTSLAGFKTLDMRVGPDCFLEISQNFKGCINVSPTGGSENWNNIRIYLQDSANHLSRGVAPASYLAAPQTIAVSVPPDAQGPWIPRDPLGHAILQSLRIPISAFQQSGFNLASVKYVRVVLGSSTSRGGLYFGDVWAVGAASNALALEPEGAVADTRSGDTRMILAQATGLPSPAGLPFLPAAGGSAADTTVAAPAAAPAELAVSPTRSAGNRIVSVRRGSVPSQPLGFSSDSPDAPATSTLATVEFTLATPQPLTDTSDAGFRLVIGGTEVPARYFETGLEGGTPSITKLVVPASAVEAAPDGASITVKNAADSWTFGALSKEGIR